MSLTISNKEFTIFGNMSVAFCDVAFDASYPTGGEALTPEDLRLGRIVFMQVLAKSGYVFEYDYTNKLLMVFRVAGFTPSGTVAAPTFTGSALATHAHDLVFGANAGANAVTMAANSLRNASAGALTVTGGGADGGIAVITAGTPDGTNSAPAFTGAAVAAAVMVEVANATNLSTLTAVKIMAIGRY